MPGLPSRPFWRFSVRHVRAVTTSRLQQPARSAGRRACGRHDARGRRPVLFHDPGRHGRGRDQSGAAGHRRRQPPLRAAVRPGARRRPAQPVLRVAQPEQAERVRGLPAARGQGHRPRPGAAFARVRRELCARHAGQVSGV